MIKSYRERERGVIVQKMCRQRWGNEAELWGLRGYPRGQLGEAERWRSKKTVEKEES